MNPLKEGADVVNQMVFRYPVGPGHKARGTSEESAHAMAGRAPVLRRKALEWIVRSGPLTADEVAGLMGESILAIRPRISELKRLGAVGDSGVRRSNRSGRRAVVWEAR